jgi:hypothetical protein
MTRATVFLGACFLLLACRRPSGAPAEAASAVPEIAVAKPDASAAVASTSASASTSPSVKAEDWVIRVKRYSLADGFGRTYWFYPSGKVESETLIDGKDSQVIDAAAVKAFVDGLSQCGLCAPGKKPGDATAGKSKRFLEVEVKGAGAAGCYEMLPWESWPVAEKTCLAKVRAGMKTVGEDQDLP